LDALNLIRRTFATSYSELCQDYTARIYRQRNNSRKPNKYICVYGWSDKTVCALLTTVESFNCTPFPAAAQKLRNILFKITCSFRATVKFFTIENILSPVTRGAIHRPQKSRIFLYFKNLGSRPSISFPVTNAIH
jgi:hypothetical protein